MLTVLGCLSSLSGAMAAVRLPPNNKRGLERLAIKAMRFRRVAVLMRRSRQSRNFWRWSNYDGSGRGRALGAAAQNNRVSSRGGSIIETDTPLSTKDPGIIER